MIRFAATHETLATSWNISKITPWTPNWRLVQRIGRGLAPGGMRITPVRRFPLTPLIFRVTRGRFCGRHLGGEERCRHDAGEKPQGCADSALRYRYRLNVGDSFNKVKAQSPRNPASRPVLAFQGIACRRLSVWRRRAR